MSTISTGFRSEYSIGAVNRFDFYSGSQITVWFGNILIDDISSIQYQRVQNKRPIYGYASQQFDAVAKGTVIIEGSFIINFRQRGYLSAIFESIRNLYGNIKHKRAWPSIKSIIGLHLKNGTFGPTAVQDIKNIGDSPNFLELAKAYEDIIWGSGLPGVEETEVEKPTSPDVKQSEDLPDGFNILITYGNTSGSEAITLNDQLQSTAKSIVGVHLIGESQMIQVGGQSAVEQYNFLARGTDEHLGTTM